MSEAPSPAELASAVAAAARRLAPWVVETPLLPAPDLSERTGATVVLKAENLQHTGSFKVRGAFHRLLALGDAERRRGVVAASTGNHGAAVAYAAGRLGVAAEVFVPAAARPGKVAAIERHGPRVRRVEGDPVCAELAARRHAEERGMTYLSPYNDPLVVAGQGTVGVEIGRTLPRVDEVYVAVGGGGLISGVAAWLRAERPGTRVVGCSPAASPVMQESVAAGGIVELTAEETLSDATAGGLEPGSITLPLCAELVDEWVTVEEEEIREALVDLTLSSRTLVEGSAAVA
ncbi:MAG: pyridoxal-phosphate dependent enzyme, partial [Thermoanaerobaculia bacterium]|nr:pyridoxal-phosphate dependent enzyme [Thermoanaerobaculia bacterium]